MLTLDRGGEYDPEKERTEMSCREMFVFVLAFCFFAQTGLSQARRRSTQRIPLDLVRLFVRDVELRGCLDSEYGGDIRKFANDMDLAFDTLIDLNNDGRPEFLISAPLKCALCGSGGCDTYVYQESNGSGYSLLLKTDLGSVSPKKTISNGYRDLLWSIGSPPDRRYTTYRFIEGGYKPSECIRVISEQGKRQTFKC
jgi:hypothetical protein